MLPCFAGKVLCSAGILLPFAGKRLCFAGILLPFAGKRLCSAGISLRSADITVHYRKIISLTYSAVCEDIVDGQVCVDRLVYGGVLLHCVHKHFHKAVNDHIVDLIDNAVSMLSMLVCKRR